MSSKDRQLLIQYLGVPGSTHECLDALVTILTSPYRCREITVLFCPVHEHPSAERKHYAVSFVVWDWLGTEVTIIPDGFGTHGGTGGWGLRRALELIQYYRVPLKEKWIRNADQFERINSGYPTKRDLKALHESDHGAPSWPLHAGEPGADVFLDVMWEEVPFPYWLLESELVESVRDVEHDPDHAVFQAVKRLEIIIRESGSCDARLVGVALVTEAMGKQGALRPHGATEDEAEAWFLLFRGAIGAIKNPQSHRHVHLTLREAAAQILTVNLLLHKLKADFPEKFDREDDEQDNQVEDEQ